MKTLKNSVTASALVEFSFLRRQNPDALIEIINTRIEKIL